MNDEGIFFRLLGVKRESTSDNMQLPLAEKVRNHIGSMHASAQFALAEIASADFLRQQFPDYVRKAVPVVRRAEIKFSKKVDSALVAFPYFDNVDSEALQQRFHRKGHVIVPVNVKLKTKSGDVATHAVYHWFVTRL